MGIKDAFFKKMDNFGLALSYEDVKLKTNFSNISPANVELNSSFSLNVPLNNPIISSPMDTVTEHQMAIELAKLGGLGIIHRNFTPKEQTKQVARVKYYLNGLIKKPICVNQNEIVGDILKHREKMGFKFHSFPVLNDKEELVGLVTQDDFEFCIKLQLPVSKIMTTKENLVIKKNDMTIEAAFKLMQEKRIKILPLIDKSGKLFGMYTFSDVKRIMTGSSQEYNLDDNGNLRVGAAVGVGEEALERAELLVKKNIDVIVIDTAHGDKEEVICTLKELKKLYLGLDIVVGNISEGDSARRLVDNGADGIRVGQGPGSICTTRIVTGIGCPQVTALYNCAKAIKGSGIPVCADGGIRYSGDMAIAIGAGADSVMLGNMLAGTKETPGDIIMIQGAPYKSIRGMGSLGAMEQSRACRERYGQKETGKDQLVPEGIEGVVPFKGPIAPIIYQSLEGIRRSMGYIGAQTIREFKEKADFHRTTQAGLRESHPHDVTMVKPAPNYNG